MKIHILTVNVKFLELYEKRSEDLVEKDTRSFIHMLKSHNVCIKMINIIIKHDLLYLFIIELLDSVRKYFATAIGKKKLNSGGSFVQICFVHYGFG